MFWFTKEDAIEKALRKTVSDILNRALGDVETSLGRLKESFDLGKKIRELQESIEALTIERDRKEEEFARKEREVEHKIGLERKRQEFEIEAAKREATLSIREENLAADRKRFEDQMGFHEKRFTEEVTYLKDMIGQVMERLPNVAVTGTLKRK